MLDRILTHLFFRLTSDIGLNPLHILTPVEKWEAARSGSSGGLIPQQYITIGLISLLVIMLVMLVKVSMNRLGQDKQRDDQAFIDNVRRHNLSVREYKLLQEILRESRVRHKNDIFRKEITFDRGADRFMANKPADAASDWEQRLHAEIGFLKDKLGLTGMDVILTDEEEDRAVPDGEGRRRRHQLSSRELPLGKQLFVTRRLDNPDDDFQGTIIANTNEKLELQIEAPVKINFGEIWRARYYFGASVWEFETTVISYDGDHLVLRHSHDVRFVNRRRFARVPTEHRAYIALYPFVHMEDASAEAWTPVHFVPATVTELAGPGLRVETDLEAKAGDRVLISFRIEAGDAGSGCVIEAMGDVKRTEPMFDQFALGLRLIGLKDSDIDHLVRVTNQVARTNKKAKTPPQTIPEDPELVETDTVLEAVIDGEGGADV